MLFNLGFTADAAAAHADEEESKNKTKTRRLMPLPSLPDFVSFATSTTPTPTPPLSSKPSHQTIASHDHDDNDANDDDDDETATENAPLPTIARPRARSARPKTLFQFAHPVASQRHRRLTLRPKLLLQLHESSAMSRPFPKYDVLPASFAPRLACKFPKLFASLRGLGPRDLVVVTSDMYEQQHDDDRSDWSEESSQDQREILATICQPLVKDDPQQRSAAVEIVSGLGVSWTGVTLPNGSYELVCSAGSQQQGRKARWVAREKGTRRVSGNSTSVDGLKRFTFSVIDPNSRRHPVIASMTRNGIDVCEQYAAVSPNDETQSSPPQSPRELIDLDEELRALIVTSGIWIAFMEGWAKNPNDTLCLTNDSLQPSLRSKSSTFPGTERNPSSERFSSAAEASNLKKKNRASTQSEIGPLRQGTLRSAKSRYRQSLSAEGHDQKWTNLQKQEAGDESEKAAGDNPPSKGKSWRRLSGMFGKKSS